jgi:hypothetical protein
MDFGPNPSTEGPALSLSGTRWSLVAEMRLWVRFFLSRFEFHSFALLRGRRRSDTSGCHQVQTRIARLRLYLATAAAGSVEIFGVQR